MDNKKTFKPFISADKVLPEFTVASIVLGILLAVVFGAANAYLGLKVGMTVSASIPAAVISMGVIRVILKKDSILENNMVQTIGSAGESLAAGAIFTMPALFLWAREGVSEMPSLMTISIIALLGGVLGVLFMVPLRTALIVEEHGVLPYPEGTACAEVLLAGEEGGSKASLVFAGLGLAAVYNFFASGINVFPEKVNFAINWNLGETGTYSTGFGANVLPSLVGVGYICGPRIASYMFAGGFLSWFVLIPMIAVFGGEQASRVLDSSNNFVAFKNLSAEQIWSNYIKYFGAGAVAAGGVISLVKTFPTMIKTFKQALGGFGKNVAGGNRTQKDLPLKFVIGGVLAVVVILAVVPSVKVNILGAFIIVIFGFFFATVSSRMVGLVGSSNNPVSGMAIATLLVTTVLLKATGTVGTEGMLAAISIGSIICIVAAMAGDTSQDLKTGYIVGATPIKQQIGELIGVIVASLAIGGTMMLLNNSYAFGSEKLPAPQAILMKSIIEGVMDGKLPWILVIFGAAIAIVLEILGISGLAFAIGVYLPIHLSAPIMVGGLIKLYIDKRKYANNKQQKESDTKGTLFAAGMIAGEGIVGVLLAIPAAITIGEVTLAEKMDLSATIYGKAENIAGSITSAGNYVAILAFALLLAALIYVCRKNKNIVEVETEDVK